MSLISTINDIVFHVTLTTLSASLLTACFIARPLLDLRQYEKGFELDLLQGLNGLKALEMAIRAPSNHQPQDDDDTDDDEDSADTEEADDEDAPSQFGISLMPPHINTPNTVAAPAPSSIVIPPVVTPQQATTSVPLQPTSEESNEVITPSSPIESDLGFQNTPDNPSFATFGVAEKDTEGSPIASGSENKESDVLTAEPSLSDPDPKTFVAGEEGEVVSEIDEQQVIEEAGSPVIARSVDEVEREGEIEPPANDSQRDVFESISVDKTAVGAEVEEAPEILVIEQACAALVPAIEIPIEVPVEATDPIPASLEHYENLPVAKSTQIVETLDVSHVDVSPSITEQSPASPDIHLEDLHDNSSSSITEREAIVPPSTSVPTEYYHTNVFTTEDFKDSTQVVAEPSLATPFAVKINPQFETFTILGKRQSMSEHERRPLLEIFTLTLDDATTDAPQRAIKKSARLELAMHTAPSNLSDPAIANAEEQALVVLEQSPTKRFKMAKSRDFRPFKVSKKDGNKDKATRTCSAACFIISHQNNTDTPYSPTSSVFSLASAVDSQSAPSSCPSSPPPSPSPSHDLDFLDEATPLASSQPAPITTADEVDEEYLADAEPLATPSAPAQEATESMDHDDESQVASVPVAEARDTMEEVEEENSAPLVLENDRMDERENGDDVPLLQESGGTGQVEEGDNTTSDDFDGVRMIDGETGEETPNPPPAEDRATPIEVEEPKEHDEPPTPTPTPTPAGDKQTPIAVEQPIVVERPKVARRVAPIGFAGYAGSASSWSLGSFVGGLPPTSQPFPPIRTALHSSTPAYRETAKPKSSSVGYNTLPIPKPQPFASHLNSPPTIVSHSSTSTPPALPARPSSKAPKPAEVINENLLWDMFAGAKLLDDIKGEMEGIERGDKRKEREDEERTSKTEETCERQIRTLKKSRSATPPPTDSLDVASNPPTPTVATSPTDSPSKSPPTISPMVVPNLTPTISPPVATPKLSQEEEFAAFLESEMKAFERQMDLEEAQERLNTPLTISPLSSEFYASVKSSAPASKPTSYPSSTSALLAQLEAEEEEEAQKASKGKRMSKIEKMTSKLKAKNAEY